MRPGRETFNLLDSESQKTPENGVRTQLWSLDQSLEKAIDSGFVDTKTWVDRLRSEGIALDYYNWWEVLVGRLQTRSRNDAGRI